MKGKLNFALMIAVAVVIAWLVAPVSFACTPPPVEGIARSWPPSARVLVTFDSRLDEVIGNAPAPITTAVSNWNAGTSLLCSEPRFVFSSGTGPTMSFAYGPIANNPNGTLRRGLTTLNFSARITSAESTINSNIPVTFPNVLAETISHEMGHTMGLNDCIYANGCPLFSSVMEDLAPVAPWTGEEGVFGPTACDLAQVTLNAPDYLCPVLPPPHCGRILVCNEGYAFNYIDCQCEAATPIIIDLSGKGFDLTNAAGGVQFDISGTGNPMQMGWTTSGPDNAFLALPGSDGLVHNGKQLFGNATPQPPSDTPNGFAALAVYDQPANGGNGDGIIDSRDAIFSSLRLWIDENHDGICQPGELHTLPSLGVDAISLDYQDARHKDRYGNLFRYGSKLNPDDPDVSHVGRIAYDVFFVVATDPATAKNVPAKLLPETTKCKVPVPQEAVLSSAGKF